MYIDKNTIGYVNHYAERIFPDLYSELTLIDDKYRKLGKFASEEHQKERHLLIKGNIHILEIETRILDSQRNARVNEIGQVENGKLIIHQKDGHAIYWTNTLKKYEAVFKPKTNPYLLLVYLGQNPGKVFPYDDLAKQLNKPRSDGGFSAADRRVRDTVKTIRDELGLTQNPEDNIFMLNKGFGLRCDVELKL